MFAGAEKGEGARERAHWRKLLDTHLAAAFGGGRVVPLELLGEDPWWGGIERQDLLLDYVVRRILDGEVSLLEVPSGKRYLTRFEPEDFDEHLEAARLRVEKPEYPIETSATDAILRSEAEPLAPILISELQLAVGERLLLDPERSGLTLGYGRSRSDEVMDGAARPRGPRCHGGTPRGAPVARPRDSRRSLGA